MPPITPSKLVSLGLVAGSLLAVTGCSLIDVQDVSGSGRLETAEFALSGFDEVDISRGYDVRIEPGAEHAVTVTADDNVLEHLEVEVVGDRLRLDVDDGVNLDATLSALITLPALEHVVLHGGVEADLAAMTTAGELELDLTGGCELRCSGVAAGTLRADLSGGSDVACSGFTADGLLADLDGNSSLRLSGEAATAELEGRGNSRFALEGLDLAGASVRLSGNSTADLAVSGVLEADLENLSTLRYAGEPVLGAVDVDQSSAIEQRP